MWQTKLKAGALQVVLSIAITITLLLFAFILLVHIHKRIDLKSDYIIEVASSTNDAIKYSLNNDVVLNDTISITPLESDNKTLGVYKEYWGVFEKVIATARIKTYETKKVALVGGIISDPDRTASYIPRQGVKPGTISGQSFYGQQLINGTTKTSVKLPELSASLQSYLDNLEQKVSSFSNNQFINLQPNTSFNNSFLKPPQIVYSNSAIQLLSNQLIGNIIIQSRSKIVVDVNSKLEDVVLIAPEIEILNNVKGKFQAIATKHIKVGKYVSLNYPSSLVLFKKNISISDTAPNNSNLNNEPDIIIDNHSTIEGVIIYQGAPKPNNYNLQIQLKEQSKVVGEIYCNENLELIGVVEGSVFTNNFLAKQSGSIYQNHIYNGSINSTDIPAEYAGLLFQNSKKGVVQWLY